MRSPSCLDHSWLWKKINVPETTYWFSHRNQEPSEGGLVLKRQRGRQIYNQKEEGGSAMEVEVKHGQEGQFLLIWEDKNWNPLHLQIVCVRTIQPRAAYRNILWELDLNMCSQWYMQWRTLWFVYRILFLYPFLIYLIALKHFLENIWQDSI